jgi:hypothetical protein
VADLVGGVDGGQHLWPLDNRSALVGFNAVASVFEWRDGAG